METWKIFEFLLPKLAALASLLGSSMIIGEVYMDWKAKRHSRTGLSAVSRALLCMSIGDVFWSFSWFMASWVVAQAEDVRVSFEATLTSPACKFQGLLMQFGFLSSLCFNTSLSFIYLFLVRYHWPGHKITTYFNWAAGFIWIFSVVFAVLPLIFNLYHDVGAHCWLSGAPSEAEECQTPEGFAENQEMCAERRDVTNLLMFLQVLPTWITIAINARIMYVVYRQTRDWEGTSNVSSGGGGGFLGWGRRQMQSLRVESGADDAQTAQSFFGFRSSVEVKSEVPQPPLRKDDDSSSSDDSGASKGDGPLLFDACGRVVQSNVMPEESIVETTDTTRKSDDGMETSVAVHSVFSNEQGGLDSTSRPKSFLGGLMAHNNKPEEGDLDLTSHNGDEEAGGAVTFDNTREVVLSDLFPDKSGVLPDDESSDDEAPPITIGPGSQVRFDTSKVRPASSSSQHGADRSVASSRGQLNTGRRSRTVAIQGLWYIAGFFATYLVGTISVIYFIITGMWSIPLYRASYFFLAFQGVWNFIVFSKGRREMKTKAGRLVKKTLWACMCCSCLPDTLVPPSPGVTGVSGSGALTPKKGSGAETQATGETASQPGRKGKGVTFSNIRMSKNIRSDVSTEVHGNHRARNSTNVISVFSNASTVVHGNQGGMPSRMSGILNSIVEDGGDVKPGSDVPPVTIKPQFRGDIALSGFSSAFSEGPETDEFDDQNEVKEDSEASVCSDYSESHGVDQEMEPAEAPRPAAAKPMGRSKDPADYEEETSV